MSYTKAAEALFITQPAVSQHIRYLEERYGTKFFTYSNRQLQLTPAGREFRRYLLEGMAKERLVSEKIREIYKGDRVLRFGATLTIGEYTIAPFIKEFYDRFKEYRISVNVDNTRILMGEIDSGAIHFALIEGLFNKSEYDSRLLAMKEFILVVHPESDLLRNKTPVLSDILDETLIVRESGSGSREVLERGLSERNRTLADFRKTISIGNVSLMKRMVQDGLGIAFMYEDAAREELDEGSLVRVSPGDFMLSREFNFVSIKDSPYKEDLDNIYSYFRDNMQG
jgi:DNA-binding transcriptional LysR family regulator